MTRIISAALLVTMYLLLPASMCQQAGEPQSFSGILGLFNSIVIKPIATAVSAILGPLSSMQQSVPGMGAIAGLTGAGSQAAAAAPAAPSAAAAAPPAAGTPAAAPGAAPAAPPAAAPAAPAKA